MGPLPFDEQDEEKEESGASGASTAEGRYGYILLFCFCCPLACIQCVRHNTTLALFCCIDGCAKVGNINFGLKLYTSFPKWEAIVPINIIFCQECNLNFAGENFLWFQIVPWSLN